ncbi:MAG: hypothetical protein ACM3S0_06920 [Acidobacteriota bacterium]
MSTQPFVSRIPSGRPMLQRVCAIGAALVGLVLILYYVVPNLLVGSTSLLVELLYLVGIVGFLSIVAAIGYWMGTAWAWYVHLASVLGQFLFPGALFEFKLDLYHMIGWTSPVISLAILITMGIRIRRRKRSS